MRLTTRKNHAIIFDTDVLPVEEEEYAPIAIREGRPTGCKAAREGNARKVALEGAGERACLLSLRGCARYSAKRHGMPKGMLCE